MHLAMSPNSVHFFLIMSASCSLPSFLVPRSSLPNPVSGVGLYFIYVRRMLLFAVLATVLTLPHLVMCFFGDSLTPADMDPLRLLTFAAGNHRRAAKKPGNDYSVLCRLTGEWGTRN